MPKIIFFDIDDTLYDTRMHQVADSTIKAMKQLREKGIVVAIATGRSLAVFPQAIKHLIKKAEIDLIVTINGQYVQYRGKTLLSFPIQPEKIRYLANALHDLGINYAFVSENRLTVAREDGWELQAVRALGLPYQVQMQWDSDETVYQMLGFYSPDFDDAVATILPNDMKQVRWHRQGVDLLDRAGSKARGIEAALSVLGIDIGDAMAFGDGANDHEMLSAVGFGVAMGNAVDSLKQKAQFVCPPVWADGVYLGLQELGILDK